MTNPDDVKDKFYNGLDNVISASLRTDKHIFLGDIHFRVGTDHRTREGIIGPDHYLFHCMWRNETIPHELDDASIIDIYKKEGYLPFCGNHRGISILVIARILLNRLNIHL